MANLNQINGNSSVNSASSSDVESFNTGIIGEAISTPETVVTAPRVSAEELNRIDQILVEIEDLIQKVEPTEKDSEDLKQKLNFILNVFKETYTEEFNEALDFTNKMTAEANTAAGLKEKMEEFILQARNDQSIESQTLHAKMMTAVASATQDVQLTTQSNLASVTAYSTSSDKNISLDHNSSLFSFFNNSSRPLDPMILAFLVFVMMGDTNVSDHMRNLSRSIAINKKAVDVINRANSALLSIHDILANPAYLASKDIGNDLINDIKKGDDLGGLISYLKAHGGLDISIIKDGSLEDARKALKESFSKALGDPAAPKVEFLTAMKTAAGTSEELKRVFKELGGVDLTKLDFTGASGKVLWDAWSKIVDTKDTPKSVDLLDALRDAPEKAADLISFLKECGNLNYDIIKDGKEADAQAELKRAWNDSLLYTNTQAHFINNSQQPPFTFYGTDSAFVDAKTGHVTLPLNSNTTSTNIASSIDSLKNLATNGNTLSQTLLQELSAASNTLSTCRTAATQQLNVWKSSTDAITR